MSSKDIYGFIAQQQDRGVPVTNEIRVFASKLSAQELHDERYSQLFRIVKWFHRRRCNMEHKK